MERYPALAVILQHGAAGALGVAVLFGVLALLVLWSAVGWLAVVFALLIGGLVYLAAKAAVELITIVTEMLVPR